jgi:nitrogen fixation protein NifU and related proteins
MMRVQTMEQARIDFWESHSVRFLEMVFRGSKRERLTYPDGYGKKTRQCGDTIEIFLMVRDGRLDSVVFETDGCLYSLACANAVAHLAQGKTLSEAWEITPDAVMDYLETLPERETHCADLAILSLQAALLSAQENARNPWKKFYR